MVTDNLLFKIQRLYAAIGAVEETNIEKFMPKVINDGKWTGLYQDWSGEITEPERANYVNSLISNIASLEYYLNKWADDNGCDKTKVKDTFNSSNELKIIHDLWNNEKHAGSSRSSKSGLCPRIGKISSSLKLTTRANKGSFVGFTYTPQGVPKILGNGTAKVIITADILGKNSKVIGDLHEIVVKAIRAWENVFNDFGIILDS